MDRTITTARSDCQIDHHNDSLEAVFVFHRHGDRTPGKSLLSDEVANDESDFWKTLIPPSLWYEMMSIRYPAFHQSNENKNENEKSYAGYDSFKETSERNQPYGFLTWKGLHQMYYHGVSMAQKYGPEGAFLDHWDVQAVSTNYLRTVMSCQAFLDGLLGRNSKIDNAPLDYDYPTHYEDIPPKTYRPTASECVEIMVRDAEHETLNAFESSPTLMKNLVQKVFATPEFISKDKQQKLLKLELIEYLPGLSKYSTYGSSPSGDISINWIHSADHFVCRSSHSVPAQQFCPHLCSDKEDADGRFERLGRATLSHLEQRFHSYYSDPQLLGEMAGPALNEVLLEMKTAMAKGKIAPEKKAFRIYSCHDVTIQALLYAIQGISLESTASPPHWPTYSTCLAIELHRLGSGHEAPSFFIRSWLSGAPIPAFAPLPVDFVTSSAETRPCFSMHMSGFEALVSNLNKGRPRNAHSLQ